MYKKISRKIFFGKKGVVDDLFDMLFIVVVIFFGLFFMYYVFTSSAVSKEDASISTTYSGENEQILLQLLQVNINYNEVEYTGAEFILYTLHHEEADLLKEKFSEIMTDGRITGNLVIYKGSEGGTSNQFTTAQAQDDYLWDDDPVNIVLENPENSNKYLVEFYGADKIDDVIFK